MSSWLPNATDGIFAALVASATGVGASLLGRRSERPAKRDAWQTRLREVERELRRANEQALKDRDEQIGDLRSQIRSRDNEIRTQAIEIARLNRELGGRGRRSTQHDQ